ncbi:Ferrichrome-iron receptor [Candidatus Burkholderia pumila]|uniref:Ferrichrome-iron receptor n=1 Tax=Candidatus Burkholderia pumila TaxID=1090375 RepID=A0ABR5HJR7_9BURK|nr:Ferrichrome-iron receptor [Candidatus Burkholderia pumila]
MGFLDIEMKTPKNENFINGNLGFGTEAYQRAPIDVNHKFGDDNAFRFNAMGHDANQPGRNVYSKRWGVAPSVAFGLNSPTTVTVSYYHLNLYDMPDFSVPFRSTGGMPINSNRSQFYGFNNRDFRYGQTDTGEVGVEHRFNDNLKLRNTTQFGRSTLDYVATNPQLLSATSNILGLQAKSGKYATNNITNQTELKGKATLLGMQHRWTGGVEFSHERSLYEGYLVTDSVGNNIRSNTPCGVPFNCTGINVWNPDNRWLGSILLNGDTGFLGAATHTQTNVASTYLFDSVKITDQWLFNAGANDLMNNSNLFSYQVGLVYKPIPTVSLYTSY